MKIPDGAEQFLAGTSWSGGVISPLAGDASFRRYFRVTKNGEQCVLMDAPPPEEDPKPFIALSGYLTEHGFAAPSILASDLSKGLVLIEDFGDARMREHLDDQPADELAMYRKTVDELKRLHNIRSANILPYDYAQYRRETDLLTEWYCTSMGLEVDLNEYDAAWEEVLQPVLARQSPPVTVLRDYHAENIMLLNDGRLGLLDFQDALAGHRAYDLVSMLQDARRDVPIEVEQSMLDYYLIDEQNPSEFLSHYAILGAQRNAKIIGIFTRLCKRDGKARYLDYLPRMWALLERDLKHPDLARLRRWFDANIPQKIRSQKMPMDTV